MGSDLVVVLGRASGTAKTLFGLNSHLLPGRQFGLVYQPGKGHAQGEVIRTANWQLPQGKRTYATLACQPADCWGYLYGVNEKRVAAGFATWESVLPTSRQGMAATDLVRLILERSSSARQATDLLTDLISRHGQRSGSTGDHDREDHIFLVADGNEAFVVEAADRFWALQEIGALRVVSDIGLIRQDWNRISPGLADLANGQGLWQCDGSKLDFAGTLCVDPVGLSSALRRWGRATYVLEHQSGQVDLAFLCHLLSDHYEETRFEADPMANLPGPLPLCQHSAGPEFLGTAGSFVVELPAEQEVPLVAWCALGPPCINVHFPVVLIEESYPVALSAAATPYHSQRLGLLNQQLQQFMGRDRECWQLVRERVAELQESFGEQVELFLHEAAVLAGSGQRPELQRLAGSLMQNALERYENSVHEILRPMPVANGGVAVG